MRGRNCQAVRGKKDRQNEGKGRKKEKKDKRKICYFFFFSSQVLTTVFGSVPMSLMLDLPSYFLTPFSLSYNSYLSFLLGKLIPFPGFN